MKVMNPPDRSCCSRSRSRWSTRSSIVSTWPYSIVALVLMPSEWAMPWISHQRSASALPVKWSSFCSRREKISAPPPGIECSPAFLSRVRASTRLDLPAPPEVVDLGRGEGLDLGLRPGVVDGLDQPLEVLEGPVRVMAAHDVRLAGARLDHVEHVLDRVLERALLALLAGEVTEAAGEHTDVRRVDVAVEHEEDLVAVQPGLDEVGHAAHAVEIVGREEGEPVLAGQALAGLDLLPDRVEHGIAESRWSGARRRPLTTSVVRVAQTDWSV